MQSLRFKNLHFSVSDGRAAAAGCLPLRTPLRSLCAHFCILKKKKGKVLVYLPLDFCHFSLIIFGKLQLITLSSQNTGSSCRKCQHSLSICCFSSPQSNFTIRSMFSHLCSAPMRYLRTGLFNKVQGNLTEPGSHILLEFTEPGWSKGIHEYSQHWPFNLEKCAKRSVSEDDG